MYTNTRPLYSSRLPYYSPKFLKSTRGNCKWSVPRILPQSEHGHRRSNHVTLSTRGRGPRRSTGFIARLWSRLTYMYYNWRKNTFNDLSLIVLVNLTVVGVGSIIKRNVWDAQPQWWRDVYETEVLIFGDHFPSVESSTLSVQIFSVTMYLLGLVCFALLLALMEQAVLDVLEERVRQGSEVVETGHTVVLGWGASQKDIKVMETVVEQLCAAYRADGGSTIVVLTQREKLEMESAFLHAIPDHMRHRTQLVFRQGSPLVMEDLQKVAADEASTVLIISDNSLLADEADSQSLRTAILLDELEAARRTRQLGRGGRRGAGDEKRGGHVVIELRTSETTELLRFAEVKPLAAMPTTFFNARRLANMVMTPLSAEITDQLWDFSNDHQVYVHSYPEFVGKSFGEVALHFPDAVLLGLLENTTGFALANPSPDYRVQPDEDLVLIRPTSIRQNVYRPDSRKAEASIGDWTPPPPGYREQALQFPLLAEDCECDDIIIQSSYSEDDAEPFTSFDLQSLGLSLSLYDRFLSGNSSKQISSRCSMLYMLPQELVTPLTMLEPIQVLVCGWGDQEFMVELLAALDVRTPRPLLPYGTLVTFFNPHPPEETLEPVVEGCTEDHIRVCHVRGDPLSMMDMGQLNMEAYKCVIVLVDKGWRPGSRALAEQQLGAELDLERDVLRIDALVLRVQLNLRMLLTRQSRGPQGESAGMNIICEKMGTEASTKYEDKARLPLGVIVSFSSYAARLMTQVAYNPLVMLPKGLANSDMETSFVDAGYYCSVGERASWWTLVLRAQACRHILLGYYRLPNSPDQAVETVICPSGAEFRRQPRFWNRGDNRLKFVILRDIDKQQYEQARVGSMGAKVHESWPKAPPQSWRPMSIEEMRSRDIDAAARAAVSRGELDYVYTSTRSEVVNGTRLTVQPNLMEKLKRYFSE